MLDSQMPRSEGSRSYSQSELAEQISCRTSISLRSRNPNPEDEHDDNMTISNSESKRKRKLRFCHFVSTWQKLELSLTLAYAKTTSNDR